MAVYAVTVFIGAFLLFQVQPLIGKYILPWYGGAPAVWTTCMVFFQVLLLGGYGYAHLISRRLKPRTQAAVHLVLIAVALLLLPITPSDAWKPEAHSDPTLQILGLLVATLGLQYFILSSTSPLMQQWFSQANPGVSPFRLYALSNVGSLLALVSFPVYFETHFTRTTQARLWGWSLAAYAVGSAFCAWKIWRTSGLVQQSGNPPLTYALPEANIEHRTSNIERRREGGAAGPCDVGRSMFGVRRSSPPPAGTASPTFAQKTLWLLLPVCASVLLLATTNKICQEVAVIPFLWVLPLALYLLSFIICFDSPRWYARLPFTVALIAAGVAVCWALFNGTEASLLSQIGIYSAALFVCSMVCHGELYRLRPDPRWLTHFYLMIAAGGALGGLFVTFVAPVIFTDYFEFQTGLLLCGLLVVIVYWRSRPPAENEPSHVRFGSRRRWQTLGCVCLALCLAGFAAALWVQADEFGNGKISRTRNFYGVLTVYRRDYTEPDLHYLELAHGRTLHGLQLAGEQRAWPTLYYSEQSGAGLALRALSQPQRRIGLVGLGVGTLAAYARTGDYVHIYEINPEVQRLANVWFTFLTNCPARTEITLGDARLSLEREPPQNFDLLALDAFNSDAIPIHLLTQEAFMVYRRHLKTNGIIAVHVSNRSLNLEPVIVNLARNFNYRLVTVEDASPPDKPWIASAVWMLLSRSGDVIECPAIRDASRPPQTNSITIPLWTDDFAGLFQILRKPGQTRTNAAN